MLSLQIPFFVQSKVLAKLRLGVLHFLLHCPRHDILRGTFFGKSTLDGFSTLDDIAKLKCLVNNPDIVKFTAQFILDCIDNRYTDA